MRNAADHQCGIEDLAHGPADYAPGEDIQDRDQIQPALTGEDCGGIADPDLIGASNDEVVQSVRRDGSTMAAVGGSHVDTWSAAGRRSAPDA